jgi:GTP-binding protein Era
MSDPIASFVPVIPATPPGFKSGFIAIIGRPNVGKSTLMNELIGQKVAITSPVAQTTRNRLRGILTTPEAQIIFVDTPGIHKPHHELGKVLVQNAVSTINNVDVVLFVVDASSSAGGGDRYIVELLKNSQTPVIVGLNKTDLQGENKEKLQESYAEIVEDNWELVNFSALTGQGLDQLQSKLIEKLEEGPYYYPPDLVTDQPERFIIGELIREQILLLTREEIPHSVAVTVEKIEEGEKLTKIFAAINVERKSQKGIIIGQKGQMLKQIGTASRKQMQKLLSGKVYLELFVKVEPKWRQSRMRLAEFGYQVDKS